MSFNANQATETGAYHIADNPVQYNPQRKNNFTLYVGIDGPLARQSTMDNITDTDNATYFIQKPQEEIILSLKACDTPVISQGTLNVSRNNSTIKFPGKPSFNDLNMTVYDYIGSDAKDTLLAWSNLCYNLKSDYIGSASVYKKTCRLVENAPDGQPIRSWTLHGSWVTDVNSGSLDYEDEGVATVTAKLVYDWAELDPLSSKTPYDWKPQWANQ